MKNHKGYEIEVDGDDILLYDSGHQDLYLIKGGHRILEDEAIGKVGHWRPDTFREEDGETLEYDSDDVRAYVETSIEGYVNEHFSEKILIEL